MASLSDLLDDTSQSATPSWVAALDRPSGFVEMPVSGHARVPSTEATESAEEDAVANAFEEGKREGRAAAEAEYHADSKAHAALKSSFDLLDKSARSALAQHLAETVATLCEQLIDEHLVDNSALSARCNKLAEMIGDSAADCSLHIHPDDVALLDTDWAGRWTIKTDPSMPRGTLRLESVDGLLCDGPDEWRRAIATVLKS